MPVSIRIEEGAGVAIIECSGVLRRDEAVGAAQELWQTRDWDGELAVWDFRTAKFDLASSDVQHIAEFVLRHQREIPPARMAFVTGRDVDFGMARMFEVFRQDSNTAFRVVKDYEEALAWVQER